MSKYPGNKVDLGQTKNNSGKFKAGEPKFLVMHYTAGGGGKGSANFLFGPHKPGSSAHFVVDRNGDVYQISDTGVVTWHAGESLWRGIQFLNSHSIGIEIANYGYWRPGISPKTQTAAKAAGWLEAVHKNGGPTRFWEPYPEAQMVAVERLTAWILETHPTIKEIVGHDDIAPGRKTDPGPAFPMHRFTDILHPNVGNSEVPANLKDATVVKKSDPRSYIVNATSLNVRGGAGTTFEVIGSLKKGAKVTILQDNPAWDFIEYDEGGTKHQGWVSGQYLTPA